MICCAKSIPHSHREKAVTTLAWMVWQKMAVAAMEMGFSENDIFYATQAGSFVWSGPMSSMCAAKLAPFGKLLQHTDPRLRKVGTIGFEHFSTRRDEHLAREKRAAVKGELC
jgi:hypothetical protein